MKLIFLEFFVCIFAKFVEWSVTQRMMGYDRNSHVICFPLRFYYSDEQKLSKKMRKENMQKEKKNTHKLDMKSTTFVRWKIKCFIITHKK